MKIMYIDNLQRLRVKIQTKNILSFHTLGIELKRYFHRMNISNK